MNTRFMPDEAKKKTGRSFSWGEFVNAGRSVLGLHQPDPKEFCSSHIFDHQFNPTAENCEVG